MSDEATRQTAAFNILDVESELREAHRRAEEGAARLLEAAEAKARALLEEALKQRDDEVAKATEEGRQAGYEEGLKEGRAHGEEQILEEQRETAKSAVVQLIAALEELPERLEREREVLVEEARRDLLSLALDVARVAAGKAAPTPGEQAASLMADLVQRLNDRHRLVVEIAPEDHATLETAIPEIRNRFTEIERVELVARDDLTPGTVIVRNEVTELEASVEDTLARLATEWGL